MLLVRFLHHRSSTTPFLPSAGCSRDTQTQPWWWRLQIATWVHLKVLLNLVGLRDGNTEEILSGATELESPRAVSSAQPKFGAAVRGLLQAGASCPAGGKRRGHKQTTGRSREEEKTREIHR